MRAWISHRSGWWAASAFAVFLSALLLRADGGAYPSTKHGDVTSGVFRFADLPRGDCGHCHDEHASRDGVGNGGPFGYCLFAANDNNLCATCHTSPGAYSIFPGSSIYSQSDHARSTSMYWPGPTPPARPSSDAGKCVNCHNPHGVIDGTGLVPSMTTLREEGLCMPCHDGSPAARNIQTQFFKSYRHPITTTGIHLESEGNDYTRFAASPTDNRHSECVDCHNAHLASSDTTAPIPPNASNRLYGVSRIQVTNGAAGTTPVYTWTGPGDTAFPKEFEICFKCHSSWTRQPAGQANLAVALNTSNPSYHPVEAGGKNRNISASAFVNGWSWDSLTYCTSCHTSDDTYVMGPHGSAYRYILKKSYTASSTTRTMASTELCFDCHSYAVYADTQSSDTVLGASRFNRPASEKGHAFHVGEERYPCFACHQSHGSTQYMALIATGRSPGINSYTQTPSGGTCTSTCHVSEDYSINYAR